MTVTGGKPKLTWDEWLQKNYPDYDYDKDSMKRGDKRANKTFSHLWAQYERYADEGAK